MNTDHSSDKIPDKSGLNANRQTQVFTMCEAAVYEVNQLLDIRNKLPHGSKELLMYIAGIEIRESDERLALDCLERMRGRPILEQFMFALARVQLHVVKHRAAQEAYARKAVAIVEDAATSKRELKNDGVRLPKSYRNRRFRVIDGTHGDDGLLPPSLLDVFGK